MFIVNTMRRQTLFEIQTMLTKSRREMLMGIRTPISNFRLTVIGKEEGSNLQFGFVQSCETMVRPCSLRIISLSTQNVAELFHRANFLNR